MTQYPETDDWRGWMVRPLRNYAVFRGRSNRREFWWYCLFLFLGYVAIFLVGVVQSITGLGSDAIGATVGFGWLAFFAANFVPGLALTTRRLHDMGLSGALLIVIFGALAILNIIAWLGYMTWMSLPGQTRDNRWGPPTDADDVADVFA